MRQKLNIRDDAYGVKKNTIHVWSSIPVTDTYWLVWLRIQLCQSLIYW